MKLLIAGAVALAGLGALIALQLPEIRRYLKIRSM
jgi:Family of unknown function (DUF6893)